MAIMDQAQQIREKIDIVSFISEYLPLKKAGRNFKANCPFHNENTPSFVVSPERQIWHCFGCGKGGDAFTFLMEYENMEFPESLRALAKKAGVVLRETGFRKGEYSEKEKIYSINSQALKFYQFILTKHQAGKSALSYLINKRKINKGMIETFSLGFSPNAGSALSDYLLTKKGYKNKDLLTFGVSYERVGKLYDFFRGRIIFPLFDHRGNVTGFSGRSLDDKNLPKYINTKETPVYHKGSMFFGLNSAKDEIKAKQDAIIVEGEFDTISLYMEGLKNVVAIKGTALTENQVNLLSRFTPKVTLCLDQDNAGFEATRRSLEVLEKKGLTASIVVLKNAKDPDEAIKKNPAEFKKKVKEAIGVYDFLIDKFTKESSKDTALGKKKITDNLLPLISNISNEIIKEHYLKNLSKIIDVSLESLAKEVDKLSKVSGEDKIIIPKKDKRTRRELLEEYLLALVIQSQNLSLALEAADKNLGGYKFEVPSYQKVIEFIKTKAGKQGNVEAKKILEMLPKELKQAFDTCFLYPLPQFLSEEKYFQEIEKKAQELFEFYKRDRVRNSWKVKN